jgi:hypothetical protein
MSDNALLILSFICFSIGYLGLVRQISKIEPPDDHKDN